MTKSKKSNGYRSFSSVRELVTALLTYEQRETKAALCSLTKSEEKMKKTKILLICAVILAFASIFVGCSKDEQITSIAIKDNDPAVAIEIQIGKFDFSSQTLLVSYDSGAVSEVTLSEDMISELDILKLYQAGEHVITVSYGGKSCELKVSVKRNTFSEVRFPESSVFVYDGKEHKVEVEGDLPANASVVYPGGNSFVNAGTYNVTAVISCDGYVTERITTSVTIQRAKYDMSGVKFDPAEFVYDGQRHSVQISGQLPEGVPAPTYYINGNKVQGVVDADTYKVTAVFANNNPNYEAIPNMETTLTITPAVYKMNAVELVFKDKDGTVFEKGSKVYDGETVGFAIDKRTAPDANVGVYYTVIDDEGNVISTSDTDTKIKDAGIYTVRLDFKLLDNKNYQAIEPMEFTFEVERAVYDTSDFLFESEITEYDGNEHSITVTLPRGIDETKFEIAYEYYLAGDNTPLNADGKNVSGVTDVGQYTVKALITYKDTNYMDIPPMQAVLVIEKKEIIASQLAFVENNLTYTGEALIPTLNFELSDSFSINESAIYCLDGAEYVLVDAAVNTGSYKVEITLGIVDDKNYAFDNGKSEVLIVGYFNVAAAVIDTSALGFKDGNATSVNKGDALGIEFDSLNNAEVKTYVTFYKVDAQELVCVAETAEVAPDELGALALSFETAEMATGTYICAITVSTESDNHVLSNGESVAEFYFEFEIVA